MYLQLDTKFNPYTYDEVIKPLQQYTDAYKEVEAAYADLAMNAESLNDLVNPYTSPDSYALYKKYSDDLSTVAEDFSKGMTSSNRRQLLNMRRRYAREIEPIKRANATFDETYKYRQEMQARDPSIVFVNHYNSPDDFLHGKKPDNEFISGKDVTARVAAKFEALAKSMYSDPQFERILGGQKFRALVANGMSPDDLINILSNTPEANKMFTQILQEEYDAIGLDRFTEADQASLMNAARTGAYAGLQKPTVQFLDNGDYMTAAQRVSSSFESRRINIMDRELAMKENEIAKQEGRKPVYVDENGTEYYFNGKEAWQKEIKETDNGPQVVTTKIDPSVIPVEVSTDTEKAKDNTPKQGVSGENTPEQNTLESKTKRFPDISLISDSFGEKITDSSYEANGTEYLKVKTDEIVEFESLPKGIRDTFEKLLIGSGYTKNDVMVAVNRRALARDKYVLIPKIESAAVVDEDDMPM